MRVAVVGGGAVGTTAAHDLAREGVAVTLYERDEIASGASGRAAGVLYDAFADRRDARVGRRALERFRARAGEGGFAFVECPYVWLARAGDERRAEAIREQVARMAEDGLAVELLDAAALGERFPAVSADDVAVAAVAEGAGHADPASYVSLMADRASEAGATVREGVEVGIERGPAVVVDGERRTHDAVLVAAGAHTGPLLAAAGVPLAVEPYRVQALVGSGPRGYDAPMLYDATAGFYCRPHPEGLLAGDGTETEPADPDDWDEEADDWFVEGVGEDLAHRLGDAALNVDRAWAGLCTATPDRDPLLGQVGDGLYVATGWQGHGFMRSPALAEAVVEEILGGEGIEGFDPTRFDGDEEFDIVEGMLVD